MISNKKVITCEVVDHIDLYNFDIQYLYKKYELFIYRKRDDMTCEPLLHHQNHVRNYFEMVKRSICHVSKVKRCIISTSIGVFFFEWI